MTQNNPKRMRGSDGAMLTQEHTELIRRAEALGVDTMGLKVKNAKLERLREGIAAAEERLATREPDPTPSEGDGKPGAAAESPARAIRERLHATHSVANVCKEQNWKCAYPCGGDGEGGPLLPGEPVARAYDNHSVVHLQCAIVGNVPSEGNPYTINGALRGSQ